MFLNYCDAAAPLNVYMIFFLIICFFCWAHSRLRRGLFLDYRDAAAPLIVYMILFFIIYFLLGPFAAAPRHYLSTAVNIF